MGSIQEMIPWFVLILGILSFIFSISVFIMGRGGKVGLGFLFVGFSALLLGISVGADKELFSQYIQIDPVWVDYFNQAALLLMFFAVFMVFIGFRRAMPQKEKKVSMYRQIVKD